MIHKEKLDSLCHINSGGTPSRGVPEYYGGKIPWAKIGDIEKSNGVIYSTEEYITEAGLESIGNRIFPKDTLLFAMYGSVGKVAFCGIELSTNQAILGIRLKQEAKEKLDLEYLKYWFQVNLLFFKRRAVGGILKNLSATIVRDFDIPLPSLTDQRRIAKLLSQCEYLIQKRKESINLLDEFLESTFSEMFGGEKEMSLIKPDLLGDNISYLTSGSRGWAQHYSDVGAKFLRIQNIGGGVIRTDNLIYVNPPDSAEAERTRAKEGDLVISITADLGRTSVIPKDFGETYINQHLALIRLNTNINSTYAAYFYNMPFGNRAIQKKNRSAVKAGLNFTDIRSFPIIIPSLELQNKFASIVEKKEIIKNEFQLSLKELENLYGSISQRAFNGELDLSKVDISDMEDSKKKDLEAVTEDLTEEQKNNIEAIDRIDEFNNSFEHALPTGEVPSNRETDIRNMSIREYLGYPEYDEATEGIEFHHMNKDYFYQFILVKEFPTGVFTLPRLEQYARKYILRGTGNEFTYDNWKTIIFRFIGAKQPIIEQFFDEETKTIKLKLTDEAFKV
jgi:type I restriction enzyme S subunit